MQEKLFSIHFRDSRERKHVAFIQAPTEQEALQKLLDYCQDRHEFEYGIAPDLEKVREIVFDQKRS